MIQEVCLENYTNVEKSVRLGTKRIELCDNLAVGGTTVSYSIAKKTIEYCKLRDVEVMCIVRPRGGDFVYSVEEISIMLEDIRMLKSIGTTGIVVGCLTQEGWIDEESMKQIMKIAGNLKVTFHMAFDRIPNHLKLKAIDTLIELGISRILTHGGEEDTDIENNIKALIEYDKYANNRVIIMPGGGINCDNKHKILSVYPFKELHGTQILERKKEL